jgi:hypothetical protein
MGADTPVIAESPIRRASRHVTVGKMSRRVEELTKRPHVIVFAPTEGARRWVQEELVGADCVVETEGSVASLVTRLSTQPGSPTMAIVDFDHTSELDRAHLRTTRTTWKGVLIALGAPPPDLRDALRIRYQIGRPFGSEVLRKSVDDVIARRGRRIIGGPIDVSALVPVTVRAHQQLR